MSAIKSIVCPTDFSPCSEAALSLAKGLAQDLGAKLTLVHVFQLPFYVGWEDGPAAVAATSEFLEEQRQRAAKRLEDMVAACREAGIEAEAKQAEGAPHDQVIELSADADLIVMGTHGRTGLPRLVLGSVAERVVRLSKCPVLTVPRHVEED
ncbi:MAG: universal stress protein [Myxococcales bacterium]|jgi:nucleotide-binding universal stress UspA family protein